MRDRRVLPYIPFSCSLTWQDVDPKEARDVTVNTAFDPEWYCARAELDFGERWHTDYSYRRDSFIEMARMLNREFGSIGVAYDLDAIPYGISQAYGCSVMASLFGKGVRFNQKGYTDNVGETTLGPDGEIGPVLDVEAAPVMKDILRQMAEIGRRGEKPDGVLNLQGVLNTAFRIRGQDIFVDMLEDPDKARRILGIVCDAMIATADAVYSRQRPLGLERNHFVTSNCTVNMLSRALYREFILPFDIALSRHYEYFGIHNCGWSVAEYVEAYGEIGDLAYLDFGIASDFAKIREVFPGPTTLAPIFNPTDFKSLGEGGIRRALEGLKDEIGPCQIILGGFGAEFDAERIIWFYRAVSEIWGVPTASLIPIFPDAF